MTHPAIIIFFSLYILNLFIKLPGISELLIFPASLLFMIAYSAIMVIIYFVIFIFSLLFSIITFNGSGIVISFIMLTTKLLKIANFTESAKIFENLFFDGAIIGVISYIILGFIYGGVIYAFTKR